MFGESKKLEHFYSKVRELEYENGKLKERLARLEAPIQKGFRVGKNYYLSAVDDFRPLISYEDAITTLCAKLNVQFQHNPEGFTLIKKEAKK